MTSDSEKPTDFSATDSALGYLFQIRLALLSSLRRLAKDAAFTVYLETLDDVVFEEEGSPIELLQLKHHCKHAANLTDASPDLWKTLRVWMEGRAINSIPKDGQLFLITTTAVGNDSAASLLLVEDRDVQIAAKKLTSTSTTSTNETNARAYALFRGLSDSEKTQLLESVVVIPQVPSIDETDAALRQEARMAVRREFLTPFVSRLEGWWFRRVVRQMTAAHASPILSNELEAEVDDLREQFKRDALPIDQGILDAEIDGEAYEGAVFVRQVKMAAIGNQRILAAIRDYYRAFEQRSQWVREDLLLVGELDRYEQNLREEWELEFHRAADELGDDAAEDAKCKAAQRVYAWVEKSHFPIRENVQHPSLSRGSLHLLANRMQIGWHPEFMARLKHLLEPQQTS